MKSWKLGTKQYLWPILKAYGSMCLKGMKKVSLVGLKVEIQAQDVLDI
jgi:hypothetical protein